MRDLSVELKGLRLHGMAGAWADLAEQGANGNLEGSRWLIEHLLAAESADRGMRSVGNQMNAARFPVHRDLAGFDFSISPVDRGLVEQLAATAFTDAMHNVVLIGGPGQRAGAGKGAGQGGAHCGESPSPRSGHPRRAGLPAL